MDLVAPSSHGAIVRAVLVECAAFAPSQREVEVEHVADEARGHFELLYGGWEGWRRVHGVVVHVDLRGDDVWIQHDGTEVSIADELIARGVDPRRIVLAFQHPPKCARSMPSDDRTRPPQAGTITLDTLSIGRLLTQPACVRADEGQALTAMTVPKRCEDTKGLFMTLSVRRNACAMVLSAHSRRETPRVAIGVCRAGTELR